MIKRVTVKPWFTGREVIELWEIAAFELFDFLKSGLQAYSKYGKKILELKLLTQKIGQTIDVKTAALFDGCIFRSFTVSSLENKARKQIAEAMTFQFKRADIEEFQNEHPDQGLLLPGEEETDPEIVEDQEGVEQKARDEEDSQKFTEFLKGARDEADFFHDNLLTFKKGKGFDERVLEDPELEDALNVLRDETIQAFTQQKEKFKWVKEDHLKNRAIYEMGPGKEKRAFIGKLLQTVVKAYYPDNNKLWGDYERLYKLSQEIEKK